MVPSPRRGAAIPPLVRHRAFSLVELLVALGVVAVLAALLASALPSTIARTRNAQCLAKMKNIGNAIFLYAQDHDGEFPRSMHSASRFNLDPWAKTILPYLAAPDSGTWDQLYARLYRCPEDKARNSSYYGYGLNVFYELDPDGDDYTGAPASWRRPVNVPNPSKTILLAESRSTTFADHIMCHMWSRASAATTAIDTTRHGKKTSNFVFADGHVESLPITATYDPAKGINLWNPSLAGK